LLPTDDMVIDQSWRAVSFTAALVLLPHGAIGLGAMALALCEFARRSGTGESDDE
jgi:hypothetical protein